MSILTSEMLQVIVNRVAECAANSESMDDLYGFPVDYYRGHRGYDATLEQPGEPAEWPYADWRGLFCAWAGPVDDDGNPVGPLEWVEDDWMQRDFPPLVSVEVESWWGGAQELIVSVYAEREPREWEGE